MSTQNDVSPLPEVVARVFSLLEPLGPEARARVIASVLSLFGEELVLAGGGRRDAGGHRPGALSNTEGDDVPVGKRAALWMSRHAVSAEALQELFHFSDGGVELIGHVPGKTRREQTIAAYLLVGVRELLRNDEPRFTEEQAVAVCKRAGCYDRPNHSVTRSQFGSRVAGSKDSGYSLTNPGLDAAAALINENR